MLVKGITRRWLFNGMGLIFAILALTWILFSVGIRTYFYNNVIQYLDSTARYASNSFSNEIVKQTTGEGGQVSDLYSVAKNLVEGFTDKDKMELMILDTSGNVVITSSGFKPGNQASEKDFMAAQRAADGRSEWDGYSPETGEKIMAVTAVLKGADGEKLGDARYVVSLTNVDMQIAAYIFLIGLVCIVITAFVMLSGTYFVNSIVVPVREIGSTARRIAAGDFQARLDKKYDDEIGQLCDTINFMAGELDSADRMKNDFVSSVSHELRTPLTAIKGWSETILSSGPSDRETLTKGMGVIIEETERLSTMVEELLDFSRMQGRRFKLFLDRIDVLAELEDAVLMFSDRAKRESLSFVYNEPESLPAIMGDKNKLRQVFVNIIDNAFKYSNQGGQVTVKAESFGASIKIIISDTGCGIPKEDLPHVKEKFFKGNNTRRGAGIGLAVSEEIVNLHGGILDIDSTEGKGTTVTISLPVCQPNRTV